MTMRKTVILCLFTGTMILTAIMSILLHKSIHAANAKAEMDHLENTMRQVIHSVEANDERENVTYEFFSTDYLNRANIAAYLYAKVKADNIDWENMLKMLEVYGVNIVNEYGIIIDSSNPKNIGISFYEHEKLSEFLPLIEGEDHVENHIQVDGTSLTTGERMLYIGVKRVDSPYGMVQIEAFPAELEKYERLTDVKNVLEAIPTEYHRVLFAVDQSSGNLLALSENNPITSGFTLKEIEDIAEGETRSGTYQSEIDGREWAATFVCRQGVIYGYASDLSELHTETLKTFSMNLIWIFLLNLLVLILVYWLLGYMVLRDLDVVRKKIELFVTGHAVHFFGGRSKEMKELSKNLNRMTAAINSKQTRLSAMTELFGAELAGYEYYHDLNQIYCSNNLAAMMELTETKVHDKIKEAYAAVKPEWIDPEKGYYQEEEYRTKSGRLLLIRRTRLDASSYAFVQDITKTDEKVQNLQNKLQRERTQNNRDHLTGLFNRRKVEKEADKIFQKSNPEGMMFLIDLDNFKKVNDAAGHAEGDLLLKKFSRILEKQFRTTDITARLGGDEFVVLLDKALPIDILQKKLNHLLDAVRSELKDYYKEYQLSVSIGVATITRELHSFKELYQCADAAMYVVKRQGKDGFYFNQDHNTCMRENCIRCRAICARRTALFGETEG